jgi:non-specific serine/threonine protein kinase
MADIPLTAREREVAQLVAKGLTTQRIAAELGVSPRTVEGHIQQAAMRLGGDTPPRHRLTIWVFQLGE